MLSREDKSDRKQTERHGTRLTLKLPSAALSPHQLVGALACTAHRNSLNFPDIFQMSSSHRWEIRPVGITHTRVMSPKHVRMKNTGDDWNVKGWSFYNCEDHCLIWLNRQTLCLHQQPVDALLTRKQTEKKTTSPYTSFFLYLLLLFFLFHPPPPLWTLPRVRQAHVTWPHPVKNKRWYVNTSYFTWNLHAQIYIHLFKHLSTPDTNGRGAELRK